MKLIAFKRIASFLLCFAMILPVGVNAAYEDDFSGSYIDLNCAEDDCDCLEPVSNRFKVVSPDSLVNSHNTVVLDGTYEEVQTYYKKMGQTDGMPVIPPTTLKVEKFMRYTPYNDNDVVATVNGRQVTAYQVAVNAVMSGCSAEYMPICIAFAKALGNNEYTETLKNGNLTPMAYISGPVSRQLGIDNTQGMTTEEANIVLGRFIEFSLINLAGIKDERKNAFGYVQPLVFSENEEACIGAGWNPQQVEKGCDLNDSALTASSFSMWGNNLTPATDLPEEVMKVLAWDITEKNIGALGATDSETFKNTRRTIFITESVAKVLATHYHTKENLEDALIENARQSLWLRANAYYYANTDGAQSKTFEEVYQELRRTEGAKLTQSPDWMDGFTYTDIETVPVMRKGNTDIIVTGDSSRNKTQVIPGGISVTIKLELPAEWDALLTSMNYKPCSEFYLADNDNVVLPPSKVKSALTNGAYRILDPSSGATYLTREGRVYYDSSSGKLHYWAVGKAEAEEISLSQTDDASFISFLENLGLNSSFNLENGKIKGVTIRFSSNAKKPSKDTSLLTDKSFADMDLTIHANTNERSLEAGGASKDNSVIIMSDTVKSFSLNLDGELVLGDASNSFVTLNNGKVTVNTDMPAGTTAVVGCASSNKTYKTVTFYNTGDGTYKMTYNTAGTLSEDESAYYLTVSASGKNASYAFLKTDDTDVVYMRKDVPAGTYRLKLYKMGEEEKIGNSGSFADILQRVKLDSSEAISFKASGGTYEFKYEISANRLSVYPISSIKTENKNTLGFDDVNESDWYYDSVAFVKEKGLMSGISETRFDPNSHITRAMLVTILYRMEQSPKCSAPTFADVEKDTWYSNGISWAAENKIVGGIGDNKFAPNENVTREQIAQILFNYSKLRGEDVSKTKSIDPFKDATDVSSWAKDAVEWAIGTGLLQGKGNGKIDPKGSATRAEIAVILKRYIKN